MSTMPQSCILCEIGQSSNHPSHPEAPRGQDYDYSRLLEDVPRTRRLKNPYGRPFSGQCAMCKNGVAKVKYGSEGTARRRAKLTGNPSVMPYYCGECHNWHIGSQDRTVGA